MSAFLAGLVVLLVAVVAFGTWLATNHARHICICVGAEPGAFESLADEVHTVNTLSTSSTAVGRVLSI